VPLERLLGPGAARRLEPLRQRCLELGLPFEPPAKLSNTRMAVEAAEFARDAGKYPEFHRKVLAAYFAESQDIGDVDVLARIAEGQSLDAAALREALATGAYAERRQAAEEEAHRLGVTGVPTYFFTGGVRVVGAQPLEYFRHLLPGLAGGPASAAR
jgi:predicted DsbA family dithiol-disulfide isomerase